MSDSFTMSPYFIIVLLEWLKSEGLNLDEIVGAVTVVELKGNPVLFAEIRALGPQIYTKAELSRLFKDIAADFDR